MLSKENRAGYSETKTIRAENYYVLLGAFKLQMGVGSAEKVYGGGDEKFHRLPPVMLNYLSPLLEVIFNQMSTMDSKGVRESPAAASDKILVHTALFFNRFSCFHDILIPYINTHKSSP